MSRKKAAQALSATHDVADYSAGAVASWHRPVQEVEVTSASQESSAQNSRQIKRRPDGLDRMQETACMSVAIALRRRHRSWAARPVSAGPSADVSLHRYPRNSDAGWFALSPYLVSGSAIHLRDRPLSQRVYQVLGVVSIHTDEYPRCGYHQSG